MRQHTNLVVHDALRHLISIEILILCSAVQMISKRGRVPGVILYDVQRHYHHHSQQRACRVQGFLSTLVNITPFAVHYQKIYYH